MLCGKKIGKIFKKYLIKLSFSVFGCFNLLIDFKKKKYFLKTNINDRLKSIDFFATRPSIRH